MPIEIADIVEAAIKADNLYRLFVFNQHSARMADSNFYQKLVVSLVGHHFEISAKRSYTEIT